jgi:hypothetical protein
MMLKQRRAKLIQELRETNDPGEQDRIKLEIDLIEEHVLEQSS